ncbi:MAG: (Fe-S)-binding protein [Candidatus Hodarchaeota archaeon]
MLNSENLQKEVMLCYQCSKCNSVCPAFRIGEFSPRSFILKTSSEGFESVARDPSIWGCRTCGMCNLCPMLIDIPGVVMKARAFAIKEDNLPVETKKGHRSLFNLAQKLQANSFETIQTNKWPKPGQKFTESGEIALFSGSMAYWNYLLYNYELDYISGLRAVLEALNRMDIVPAIPPDLKDSGHDLIHGGEEEDFIKIARSNSDTLKVNGVKTIIAVNPEDYHTLKNIYPKYIQDFDFNVIFWTEFLVENNFLEHIEYQIYLGNEIFVAYHDPCKLGRINKIFDSPRLLLEGTPRVRLLSLEDEREDAPCCGVSAFIGCNDNSLFLRHERLKEVLDSEADVLVSTCPACVLHFNCAYESTLYDDVKKSRKPLKIMELSTFIGKNIFNFD